MQTQTTVSRRTANALRIDPAGGPAQKPRSFLGPELMAGLGANEEAPEFSLKLLLRDPKIRDLGLRLWRQMGGASAANERDMKEAGLSFADLWKPGVTESMTTSSTAEEIARYRKTLEYRAKFLEALLEETLADLERVTHMSSAASAGLTATAQSGVAHAAHERREEPPHEGKEA